MVTVLVGEVPALTMPKSSVVAESISLKDTPLPERLTVPLCPSALEMVSAAAAIQ